jgi:hypothetical protein
MAGPEGPAVARGLQYLKAHGAGLTAGEAALAAMALIKADVPASDPGLAACLASIRRRFNGSVFTPERSGGPDVYEASVVLMALASLDAASNRAEIEAAARHLLAKQKPGGGWDYDTRTAGDSSISQYAVLGLWEAEIAGVPSRRGSGSGPPRGTSRPSGRRGAGSTTPTRGGMPRPSR